MNSTSHLQAIAYHGWGFDASCWRDWQIRFKKQGWQFQGFDRGYWQQPANPIFEPTASIKLLLVHSYGLHLCPLEQLQQANVIVVFCSFAKFLPDAEPFKRRSRKVLQQMIDQFMIDPQQVLSQFRVRCYYPCPWQETLSANFDADLLLSDLDRLKTAAIDLALLQTIPQVLIWQGNQDQIIPAASSAVVRQWSTNASTNVLETNLVNNIANTSMKIKHQLVETAGHALPFTHLDHCWSALRDCLEDGITDE